MTVQAAAAALPAVLAPFGGDWQDPAVEDIFVVGPGHYFVRRGSSTERREASGLDALAIEAIAILAAHLRGQDIGEAKPILDCELPSGERLSAVVPPCTPFGHPSLAIRRAMQAMPSLEALDAQGLFRMVREKRTGAGPERRSAARARLDRGDVVGFLRECVRHRWTVGFTGETGSGKTTNAVALAMEIPMAERLVTVADTEELGRLPHPNRVSFLHAKGGPVSAEALIEAALRNAPRWLLVSEVRGPEAFAFLRALASGHPGITTWHAKSARQAFDALSAMVRQHPAGARFPEDTLRAMLASFIDVVVHCERGDGGEFRIADIVFGAE